MRPANIPILAALQSGCPWLIVALLLVITSGCSLTPMAAALVTPQSTVVAHSIQTTAQTDWLTSATFSYTRIRPSRKASEDDSLQVLGIRYPHPDGHKDRARVELIMTDPSETLASSSWHARLGQTLEKTLPGVTLGEGICLAKAIDLPLSDLQQLLVKIQPAVAATKLPTSDSAQVYFASEINGRHGVIRSEPVDAMEQLIARVIRDGQLIGYSGTAKQLRNQFEQATQVQLANSSSSSNAQQPTVRAVLVPLPPITSR